MIYHFSIYHGGSNETVQRERVDVEGARAEACRLLSQSTDRVANEMAPGEQVRVVVSDSQGLDLFTLAYVASNGALRHDISKRSFSPALAA